VSKQIERKLKAQGSDNLSPMGYGSLGQRTGSLGWVIIFDHLPFLFVIFKKHIGRRVYYGNCLHDSWNTGISSAAVFLWTQRRQGQPAKRPAVKNPGHGSRCTETSKLKPGCFNLLVSSALNPILDYPDTCIILFLESIEEHNTWYTFGLYYPHKHLYYQLPSLSPSYGPHITPRPPSHRALEKPLDRLRINPSFAGLFAGW
jgi:hypothetical protein